ncbi:MAG: hypothetical protein A2928_03580 [Candidatus Taylorbacteria bacterium RIFCSPLOWO2_01_FULL_45_15b]|uniref:D-alanine--D-alanine ligase n=1 Tax=Candidatus Taylorbacteria bacterium RIFCSPLOWO2_01_FULL_45_15b TaxID=1802319 RepID=A0A1G2NCK2_9BACT|nr:MAG: hypothetical protein A2928_03580 [Candidatus Taylorbacteria bacterium RIFCSPLOWO2_01_FULL_45_15b]
MAKISVGVLRGGPSSEYDVSLRSGAAVMRHLPEKYKAHDIFIDRAGTWHMHGVPRKPYEVARHVDIFFNALHGKYGEDGGVQKELEALGAKYTGSPAVPSAISMNKALTKEVLIPHNFLLARHVIVERDTYESRHLINIFRTLTMPYIVKPTASGSSLGVRLAQSFYELEEAVAEALKDAVSVMIEEFVRGKEASCGVIDNFRDQETYALLPSEIVPTESKIFDYDAKYTGKSQEICPGNFTPTESQEIQTLAARIHTVLGLSHYSRSDFIVTKRGIYFLEANTLPGLTDESILPKSLAAVGCTLSDFLDHVLTLAHQ